MNGLVSLERSHIPCCELEKGFGGLGFSHRDITGVWFTTGIFLRLLSWIQGRCIRIPTGFWQFQNLGWSVFLPLSLWLWILLYLAP